MSPRFLGFVLIMLTASTGVVDAVSFLSLGHVFTANMTGNVVFIALALAGMPGVSVARSGTALVAFVAGASIGARIGGDLHAKGASHRLAVILFGEGVAVLVAAAVAGRSASRLADGQLPLYAVIALTAWAMGLQSAAAIKLAVPGLMPNVLTTALTWAAANGPHDSVWTKRVASVAAMFAGALGGAWLCHFSRVWPLALSGLMATLGALAVVSVTRRGSSPSSPCLRDSADDNGIRTSHE